MENKLRPFCAFWIVFRLTLEWAEVDPRYVAVFTETLRISSNYSGLRTFSFSL